MIRNALCESFCQDLLVLPVSIGFSVRTPYFKSDGDYAGFYLHKHPTETQQFRIEDDGRSISDLE